MHRLHRRIDRRLLSENTQDADASWKNPKDENYDREYAEDALYHTIGPLTDSPRWSNNWTSNSEPVPGFMPGGPAPRWTPEEVIMAYAGDPNLLYTRSTGNPRSPLYGKKGGSPLYRLARRTARKFSRGEDRSFIDDMFSNGFVPLLRLMQPGFDAGQAPFISYVHRSVISGMELGPGGTTESIRATGKESKSGVIGLKAALETTDPDRLDKIARQVKGKFRRMKTGEKHPDNPFGIYSSRFYEVVSNYADAIRDGDENEINIAYSKMQKLAEIIEDETVLVGGAGTGLGQAISNPDRKTSVGVTSIDVETDNETGSTMAGSMVSPETYSNKSLSMQINQEAVNYILDIALKEDLKETLSTLSPESQERYTRLAVQFANARSKSTGGKTEKKDVSVNITGKMTANQYRSMLRVLGPLASNYPGKGVVRSALNIPRETGKWWKAGEDPEIEPIPSGGLWESIWLRNGCPSTGSAVQLADEFTQETKEFNDLGIKTGRTITVKTKKTARGTEQYSEAISKNSAQVALSDALVKISLIAYIHRDDIGLDKYLESANRSGTTIIESVDTIDRKIIFETCNVIIRKLRDAIISSVF